MFQVAAVSTLALLVAIDAAPFETGTGLLPLGRGQSSHRRAKAGHFKGLNGPFLRHV